MMRVAIVRQNGYDKAEIKSKLYQIIENTDFPEVEGKTVLVKPNILSDSKPQKGITTNPVFVEAFLELLNEKNVKKIYIGDSPGLQTPTFRGKVCGIAEVAERQNAEFVDFTDHPVTKKITSRIKLPLASVIDRVDMVFSLSKFKTHQLMYATGAVKNLFGLVPGLNKSPCHLKAPAPASFANLITGIYKTVKPAYSLMDGIIGMEGPGPANGTLRQVGLILGSADGFGVDMAEALIMGYNPKDIPILESGRKQRLSTFEFEYPLLDPKELIINDYRRIPISRKTLFNALILPFFTRIFDRKKTHSRPAPRFDHDKCIKCLRCKEICPAKALNFEDGKIQINEDHCIRCYCCHEMCPADAIIVKK
jgi:Uncharacterized conserved protein